MSVLTVDVNTDIHQARRFPAWIALFVFSAVCLAAMTSTTEEGRNTKENWVVAASCMSMLVAFLASAAYLFARPHFVGRSIEVLAGLFLLVVWCVAWPVIMNIDHGIAVVAAQGGGLFIINANLYFFTWLALAAVLFIVASAAQEFAKLSLIPSRTNARWLALAAASIIVMSSAARVLRDTSTCQLAAFDDSEYCRRTRWAVGLGCISTIIALFFLVASRCFTLFLTVEFAISTLLLVLWCFGVGYITFGNTPGATISNIYFGAWIAFLVTVFQFADNFREYMATRSEEGGGPNSKNQNDSADAMEKQDEPTSSPHKDDNDEDSYDEVDMSSGAAYKIGDDEDDEDMPSRRRNDDSY
ncbi:hypothetical protein FisN_13Lh313 [Fistulifera solaris]|uniref:Uncharacterized protein n=1 Tax=Fistulifera solaris TaxID=1519565 RepID=A0A1Z5KLT8_FISSO|nr:hypothetical protein FisN_13Lh313 [Fistulifera solaris]|eukprot:GAX27137.1 hypothetical protein FisN_13Lh313 [Fistulifera solaris]